MDISCHQNGLYSYHPKLLQKCETARVRKGTDVNIFPHGTDSFSPSLELEFGWLADM
jgi:hypothetical protein